MCLDEIHCLWCDEVFPDDDSFPAHAAVAHPREHQELREQIQRDEEIVRRVFGE